MKIVRSGKGRLRRGAPRMSKGSALQKREDHSQENPGEHPRAGNRGRRLTLDPKSTTAVHLTLPGRQKEKTVLGWRRLQSLSQQQFKSQVPGVKSQMQIGKAISAS